LKPLWHAVSRLWLMLQSIQQRFTAFVVTVSNTGVGK